MSGHNKWSKVKHKKEITDAKKSKVFSELSRQISLEAKHSRGDKNSPGLRLIIEKARGVNMPNENIERAVARGVGSNSGTLTKVLYEAYGPGGIAMLIEGETDNNNRTSQEVRHILDEHGAALSSPGSVTWAFVKKDEGWKAVQQLEIATDIKAKLRELTDALEIHDDISSIYTNALP